MANTTTAVSGQPLKNSGGTIFNAGTISGFNRNLKNLSIRESLDGRGIYGSQVLMNLTGRNNKATKAITGGEFAKMRKGNYVAIRLPSNIAGLPGLDTILLTGSSVFTRNSSVNYATGRRSVLSVSAGWNYSTGRYLTSPVTQRDSFGHDNSLGTLAIPGRFTYVPYSNNVAGPTVASYPPKTG